MLFLHLELQNPPPLIYWVVRGTGTPKDRESESQRQDLYIVVYYESIKRELKTRLIYEYRCDERLKTKNEESTRLADTGLVNIFGTIDFF